MITDNETNKIYFAGKFRLEHPKTCKEIETVLQSYNLKYDFLSHTKDIWVRDFMPIQVSENKFIEYRYDPDYLQAKKYRQIKSYPDMICDAIGLRTSKTDLIIDGGNVIKHANCVILTDKVVHENIDFYSEKDLVRKLIELFEVDKIVLIPWDKEEPYGHVDGMIRFIDENNVLIQGYYDSYDEKFRRKLYGVLEKNGLSWEKLIFDGENIDERSWSYMNFLQTKDLILIPSYGIDEDDQAVKQIEKHFPEYSKDRILKIDMNEIIKGEGGLNCVSWTIKE